MSNSPSVRPGDVPYDRLSPDVMLDALQSVGLVPDGRMLALNSYENRVYQMGLEDEAPVVVKFYRPGRWSAAAIEEEHAFALELAADEIPVVAPARVNGRTLHGHAGYLFAVYPRRGGRWPDLDTAEDRQRLGRFLGRIHRIGGRTPFFQRDRFDPWGRTQAAVETVLNDAGLPDYLQDRYADVTASIADGLADTLEAVQPRAVRIHGDCHRGNILWTDAGGHVVDLDDCTTGPAVQDLWMLVAGSPDDRRRQWLDILEGYEQFGVFDRAELALVEPLRAFRMVHYAAWLARRWRDPAFPKAFPWFGGARYWEDHVRELLEQRELMEEPTLRL